VRIPTGVVALMVCERAAGGLPSREEIRRRLRAERFDIQQRRYIRDLRSAAFIEVRM
jgi:peptidyl-prolyl cis-trans isomerase SurA